MLHTWAPIAMQCNSTQPSQWLQDQTLKNTERLVQVKVCWSKLAPITLLCHRCHLNLSQNCLLNRVGMLRTSCQKDNICPMRPSRSPGHFANKATHTSTKGENETITQRILGLCSLCWSCMGPSAKQMLVAIYNQGCANCDQCHE